ncbi:MAG: class I SAM-dependent methyltransferase [Bacteroidota bacterium]
MIFFRAAKYLKYILIALNRRGHGIHSPFVFDLVSRVFRNKIDTDIVCCIEKVRKTLISDPRSIIVTDFGQGSEKLKTNIRKVSDIARNSPVSGKYGVLLSNMAAEFGGQLIVEFGTSLGISTMYMALSDPDTLVNTIEDCPAISEIAKERFKEAGIKNIEVLTGSFNEVLPFIINKHIIPGLVFIKGDHRKEPVINYFTQIMEISDSKTVIIIDDINYSREMEEAWNEIKRFEKVSLTIDLHKMGIVFFREGINHRDYVIRY